MHSVHFKQRQFLKIVPSLKYQKWLQHCNIMTSTGIPGQLLVWESENETTTTKTKKPKIFLWFSVIFSTVSNISDGMTWTLTHQVSKPQPNQSSRKSNTVPSPQHAARTPFPGTCHCFSSAFTLLLLMPRCTHRTPQSGPFNGFGAWGTNSLTPLNTRHWWKGNRSALLPWGSRADNRTLATHTLLTGQRFAIAARGSLPSSPPVSPPRAF